VTTDNLFVELCLGEGQEHLMGKQTKNIINNKSPRIEQDECSPRQKRYSKATTYKFQRCKIECHC
jgi:hypothetical protein